MIVQFVLVLIIAVDKELVWEAYAIASRDMLMQIAQ